MRQIAVVGSDSELSGSVEKIAEGIGRDIAKEGCVLVCGGRGGVMEAACRGAKEAGGTTVGILPGLDKEDANSYIDIVITTGMGYARNSIVVSCADAVIAVSGRVGTLSEVALALNHGKPVVVVEGSGGISESVDQVVEGIHRAKPEEAVKAALGLI